MQKQHFFEALPKPRLQMRPCILLFYVQAFLKVKQVATTISKFNLKGREKNYLQDYISSKWEFTTEPVRPSWIIMRPLLTLLTVLEVVTMIKLRSSATTSSPPPFRLSGMERGRPRRHCCLIRFLIFRLRRKRLLHICLSSNYLPRKQLDKAAMTRSLYVSLNPYCHIGAVVGGAKLPSLLPLHIYATFFSPLSSYKTML